VYSAPFEYLRAGSWEEAVALLSEHGEGARAIAGGQSLVPMMMFRLTELSVLVDLADVDAGAIEVVDGHLVLPALTRYVDLETSAIVRSTLGVLSETAACIGNVRVRNRGTVGGSLAHADPSVELPCLTVALGGRVRTLGAEGARTMPVRDIFSGYFETTLRPHEMITALELPLLPARSGAAFAELTRRASDFASVEVAAVVTLDEDGRCCDVRLVVGAVASRPLDVSRSVAGLLGGHVTDDAVASAVSAVAADIDIEFTAHGSIEYQRRMVEVFAGRALRKAAARASNGYPRAAA
jgi:aerobic carbon-monoxide dehydrogenase medium subunit